jgi:hypothetical protein
MSEGSFTKELLNQSMKVERECQKLQALLNDKIPNVTFKWSPEDDEILLFKTEKRKRQRTVIHDDNPEDDEDDEPEIKPKLDVLFKREEGDNYDDNTDYDNNANDNDDLDDNTNDNDDEEEDEDLIRHLSRFSQQLQDVPVTWGYELQSPWSQHQEQNTLLINIVYMLRVYNKRLVCSLLFCITFYISFYHIYIYLMMLRWKHLHHVNRLFKYC